MGMRKALLIGGLATICGFMPNETSEETRKLVVAVQEPQVRNNNPLDIRMEEFSSKWNINLRIDQEVREQYSHDPRDIKFMHHWVAELDEQLGKINPTLLRNVTEIVVDSSGMHPDYMGQARLLVETIALHVSSLGDLGTLTHEFAHHYFFNTPGFQEQWNNIVSLEPNGPEVRAYKRASSFNHSFGLDSRYGFVDVYGTTFSAIYDGWIEDPATYVGEIYSGYWAFRNVRDRNNPRYEKKLELLLGSGAITREQFDEAMNFLGVGETESEKIARIEALRE